MTLTSIEPGKQKFRARVLAAVMLALSLTAYGQTGDVPIGTWRMHLSYNEIISLAVSSEKVYGASEMGIVVYDKQDQNISTYNKLSGLTGSGITSIAYDESIQQLIIAYEDGNIDLVENETIINFSRLHDLNTLPGSRRLNHVAVSGGIAYLSTDYGVVVFQSALREVKETWRDLGPSGTNLKIRKAIVFQDSIFLATERGVLAGALGDNLLDYNQWQRFDTGDLSGEIESIAVFDGKLYAAVKGKGIYVRVNKTFQLTTHLVGMPSYSLEGSANTLLITSNGALWSLSKTGELLQVSDNRIMFALVALQNGTDTWIGDQFNGLIAGNDGGMSSIIPNGPWNKNTMNLEFANGEIYAISGQRNEGLPSLLLPGYSNFKNGQWSHQTSVITEVTDIARINNNLYVASLSDGILQKNETAEIIFDETNSSLQNTGSAAERQIRVPDIESSGSALWATNYGAFSPLHVFQENTWRPFTFSFSQASYPTILEVGYDGKIWMAIDPVRGGGIIVMDPETGQHRYLTETNGQGGLPHFAVRSLALDLGGNMWVGTNAGVGYFFTDTEDAVLPIFENRFLLKDEKITAIAVDGGNRKWMGTERGVWLFNAEGDQLIHNFTAENSPLLSNVIHDIVINAISGDVFFATDKGVVSFRGDATAANDQFAGIKIFPNPVTSAYSGTVGISGLASDAFVKITDVTGKLVSQFQANGGTAVWNVTDRRGKRVPTGVYLVFAASGDGSESMVGKIAIVD